MRHKRICFFFIRFLLLIFLLLSRSHSSCYSLQLVFLLVLAPNVSCAWSLFLPSPAIAIFLSVCRSRSFSLWLPLSLFFSQAAAVALFPLTPSRSSPFALHENLLLSIPYANVRDAIYSYPLGNIYLKLLITHNLNTFSNLLLL